MRPLADAVSVPEYVPKVEYKNLGAFSEGDVVKTHNNNALLILRGGRTVLLDRSDEERVECLSIAEGTVTVIGASCQVRKVGTARLKVIDLEITA